MTNPQEVLDHIEKEREIEAKRRARFNTDYFQRVVEAVFAERRRQVTLGHEGHIPWACEAKNTPPEMRLGVLGEEFGEVCKAIIEEEPPNRHFEELVHVAAVAIASAEGTARAMGIDPGPIDGFPETAEHKERKRSHIVQGTCPMGCGHTLMLGSGGYIVCSFAECPEPDAIAKVLDRGRYLSDKDPHLKILLRAYEVYQERNTEYKDTWKRYGLRGVMVHLRTCVERAWETVWQSHVNKFPSPDNLIDAINYSVFAVRQIETQDSESVWQYE